MGWNQFLDALKVSTIKTPDNLTEYQISQLTGNQNTFDTKTAGNVSTVYTCISIKADTISKLPLDIRVQTENGEEVDRNDPLYYLLHYKPNAYTNAFNFFWTLEYWRNLKGNAYARITRDNKAIPVALTLIQPIDMEGYSIRSNQVYYKYYTRNSNGERNKNTITVNGSEILHFTFGSTDGIDGIDPITKLKVELSTKVKAGKTIDNLYGNNALNKALVMPQIDNEAIKKQVADFNAGTSVDSTGKLRQLPFGSELVDMSLDLNAIQFIESMKFNTTQIGSLYGIPAHMLGILEQTKFSSVKETNLDFKTKTVAPVSKMYKRELESKLLSKDQILTGRTIEFNLNALLETDLETKNKIIIEQVKNGIMSPNHAARLYGYPQWVGGDNHLMPSSSMFGEIRFESDQEKLAQLVDASITA